MSERASMDCICAAAWRHRGHLKISLHDSARFSPVSHSSIRCDKNAVASTDWSGYRSYGLMLQGAHGGSYKRHESAAFCRMSL
jgi:hypothetical protein